MICSPANARRFARAAPRRHDGIALRYYHGRGRERAANELDRGHTIPEKQVDRSPPVEISADPVAVKEDHDLPDDLLLGPGVRDPFGPNRADARHLPKPIRCGQSRRCRRWIFCTRRVVEDPCHKSPRMALPAHKP